MKDITIPLEHKIASIKREMLHSFKININWSLRIHIKSLFNSQFDDNIMHSISDPIYYGSIYYSNKFQTQ